MANKKVVSLDELKHFKEKLETKFNESVVGLTQQIEQLIEKIDTLPNTEESDRRLYLCRLVNPATTSYKLSLYDISVEFNQQERYPRIGDLVLAITSNGNMLSLFEVKTELSIGTSAQNSTFTVSYSLGTINWAGYSNVKTVQVTVSGAQYYILPTQTYQSLRIISPTGAAFKVSSISGLTDTYTEIDVSFYDSKWYFRARKYSDDKFQYAQQSASSPQITLASTGSPVVLKFVTVNVSMT